MIGSRETKPAEGEEAVGKYEVKIKKGGPNWVKVGLVICDMSTVPKEVETNSSDHKQA